MAIRKRAAADSPDEIPSDAVTPTAEDAPRVSRRGFLGGAGGLAASGLVVGGIAGAAAGFALDH
ncbi:MAG TPA: hypothetical protein VIJ76_00260 [Galbitalea sp.]